MTTLLTLFSQVPEASELLKEDTLASYYTADFQYSIGRIVSEHDNDSQNIILEDLNEKGMKLYNHIQEKIQKDEWEDMILQDASIDTIRSGAWRRNKDHPAHSRAMEESDNYVGGYICSWRNISCFFTNDGDTYESPLIILYTDDWAYTYSGKLYRLQLSNKE
jgi:hypothetical protein